MSDQPASGSHRLSVDQRAVLQLLLQQGLSYDDVTHRLGIDRAAVRVRASSAVDALAPQTDIPLQERALTIDFLPGQLPDSLGLPASRALRDTARIPISVRFRLAARSEPGSRPGSVRTSPGAARFHCRLTERPVRRSDCRFPCGRATPRLRDRFRRNGQYLNCDLAVVPRGIGGADAALLRGGDEYVARAELSPAIMPTFRLYRLGR